MNEKKVEFVDKDYKPDYPHVVRYHIYPFNIILGYIVPVCQCNHRKNNGFDYCENCGYAIPTEKESKEFNVK